MNALRRMFVSFVILFDILGFGIIFIIMSNTSRQGNLAYMAESDGVFASVIAFVGVIANVILALALARGGLAARRRAFASQPGQRSRITGE